MRQKAPSEAEILKIGRKRTDRLTPDERRVLADYWEDRLKKMNESEDRARAEVHIAQTDLRGWAGADDGVEEIRLSGPDIREVLLGALDEMVLTHEEKQVLKAGLAVICGIQEDIEAVFQAEIARKPRGKPRKVFYKLNSMDSDA